MIWYLNGGFLLVFFVKRALANQKLFPSLLFFNLFNLIVADVHFSLIEYLCEIEMS